MIAGVILESLGADQKSIEITRELNKLRLLEEYWDMIVFYLNFNDLFLPPKFATMNVVEAYCFDGPLISTDIKTTQVLAKTIRPNKKFFYMWDLEWTNKVYPVEELLQVYMNPEIELIARSSEHADIIKSCWKEPIAVIENFDYEEITKIVS